MGGAKIEGGVREKRMTKQVDMEKIKCVASGFIVQETHV